MLDDLTKLLPGGAAIASGATGASSPLVSVLTALESAITSAQIDIYTGVADHIVRRVALVDRLHACRRSPPARSDGLTGGSLDFVATLTELGRAADDHRARQRAAGVEDPQRRARAGEPVRLAGRR